MHPSAKSSRQLAKHFQPGRAVPRVAASHLRRQDRSEDRWGACVPLKVPLLHAGPCGRDLHLGCPARPHHN